MDDSRLKVELPAVPRWAAKSGLARLVTALAETVYATIVVPKKSNIQKK